MFDGYSRQIYEIVRAFLRGDAVAIAAPGIIIGNRSTLGAADQRRLLRFEDVQGDSLPPEFSDYLPLPPTPPIPPFPPYPLPTDPGGGGGPGNGGGTVPVGPGGNHSGGINVRLETAPGLPGLALPTILALAYSMQHHRDEDILTIPDDTFPIVDRFANGETEAFWRIPAGKTFSETGGAATMSVGGRAMIGTKVYTDSDISVEFSAFTSEAVDGIIARADIDGNSGYFVRYVVETDTIELGRLDAGIETILASDSGYGFTPGDLLGLSIVGDAMDGTFNGGPIVSATDATYTSGYVGVANFALSTSPLAEFRHTPL